jgi:hypothetical protein
MSPASASGPRDDFPMGPGGPPSGGIQPPPNPGASRNTTTYPSSTDVGSPASPSGVPAMPLPSNRPGYPTP